MGKARKDKLKMLRIKTAKTLLMSIDLVENQNVIANEVKQPKNRLLRCFTPRNDGKKAFTLAEVLVTLTLLGVVAGIVIPTALKNNGEAVNRTKMKKAIANYEKVVETMRLTEGYTTVDAMTKDMNVENCDKSREYFKTKTVDSSNGCIFQTSDGLWWNITDISKPIVAFEKGDDNKYIKDDTYAKTLPSDDEGLKAFHLTLTQGTPEQGYAFIVNDPSGLANKALVYAKLVEGKYAKYSKKCTCSDKDLLDLAWSFGDGTISSSSFCNSCTATAKHDSSNFVTGIVDDQGRMVYRYNCFTELICNLNEYTYNDDGSYIDTLSICQKENASSPCTLHLYSVDTYTTNALMKDSIFYNNDGSFKQKRVYINDGSKVIYEYSGCNEAGQECTYKLTPKNWFDNGNVIGGFSSECHKVDDPMCAD